MKEGSGSMDLEPIKIPRISPQQGRQVARKNAGNSLMKTAGIVLLVMLGIVIVFSSVFIPRVIKIKARECRRDDFELDSFVCKCTADYCDEIEPLGKLDDDRLVFYVSSRDQHRFKQFTVQQGNLAENLSNVDMLEVRVNHSIKFQSIFGFGAAFTDSAGLVLNSLDKELQQRMLEAYFGRENGIRYSLGRVPIASTDFSSRIYSYAEQPGDFEMNNFMLAPEDLEDKIPHLKRASELAGGGDNLRLIASPWSAPWWMKETEQMQGGGPMKGKVQGGDDRYFRAYARYLRLFFEEYQKRGIDFWAMTIQNEQGIDNKTKWWQAMQFPPEDQRDFAYHLLSPELKKSNVTRELLIMAHDNQRAMIEQTANLTYEDEEKSKVIAGLAVHWYSFSPYVKPLQNTHAMNANKFILSTEASAGDQSNGEFRGPQMGNWTRGWMYGHELINNMANWVVGFVDWNFCLDMNGGPNWYGNTIDAAIIVNSTAQEFYKQPMFYFMGHFSRFIPVNSIRISSKLFAGGQQQEVHNEDAFFLKNEGLFEQIAFLTPEGQIVLVLLNGDAKHQKLVTIQHGSRAWHLTMPADSIATAIWRAQ